MGFSVNGELGYDSFFNTGQFAQVGTSNDWKFVVAGKHNTFAIKNDNSLWGFGLNEYGQLGIGNNINTSTPTQIGNNDWKEVMTSTVHTVAIKNNGTLWTWGRNDFGQLGNNNSSDTNLPIQVGYSTDWKHCVAAYKHTLCIKNDGTLWAFGQNIHGVFGNGNTYNSSVPIQIGNENNWKQIHSNFVHVIAKKNNNSIWLWGYNINGQLGNGNNINSSYPIQLGNSSYLEMSAGGSNSYVIDINGSLLGWGSNFYGNIGNNSLVDSNIPITINCPTLETENYNFNEVIVYPNPIEDFLFVKGLNEEYKEYELYDIQGRLIKTGNLNDENNNIDVSKLLKGTYILKVFSENIFFIKKCFKK